MQILAYQIFHKTIVKGSDACIVFYRNNSTYGLVLQSEQITLKLICYSFIFHYYNFCTVNNNCYFKVTLRGHTREAALGTSRVVKQHRSTSRVRILYQGDFADQHVRRVTLVMLYSTTGTDVPNKESHRGSACWDLLPPRGHWMQHVPQQHKLCLCLLFLS